MVGHGALDQPQVVPAAAHQCTHVPAVQVGNEHGRQQQIRGRERQQLQQAAQASKSMPRCSQACEYRMKGPG